MNFLFGGDSKSKSLTKQQQDSFVIKCREMGLTADFFDSVTIVNALKAADGNENRALDQLLQGGMQPKNNQ